MAKTQDKAQTPAEAQVDYACAMDKIRDAMACSKSEQIQLLGEVLTAMLQLHPELEGKILQKEKTLDGALSAVRAHATGGCSDPVRTTKSLCEYFGIECENSHALALEVTVAMMGGEGTKEDSTSSGLSGHLPLKGEAEEAGGATPPLQAVKKPADPFDLDALMGVL